MSVTTTTTTVETVETVEKKAQVTNEEFVDAYKAVQSAGGTRQDLADKLGVSYQTVCVRIRKLKETADLLGIEIPALRVAEKTRTSAADALRKAFASETV